MRHRSDIDPTIRHSADVSFVQRRYDDTEDSREEGRLRPLQPGVGSPGGATTSSRGSFDNNEGLQEEGSTMKTFAKVGWLFLLRGSLAILFALSAFFCPHDTLIALAYLFGAFALMDGITSVWMASHAPQQRSLLRSLLVRGLLGVGVGGLALYNPGFAITAFYYLVAVWALFIGAFEIVAARDLYRDTPGEWYLGLLGIASLLCGLLMIVSPHRNIPLLAWLIGSYAFVYGLLLILYAFRLRHRPHHTPPLHTLEQRPL
jgi:uncharacterized membrane protein HdeD (DUF308 family)